MPSSPPPSSAPASAGLSRVTELVVAATYRRDIEASIRRVWENVDDWEHLPWLHSDAFASIECHDQGDWGWRARVGFHGGAESEIELLTDRSSSRYVTRTLEGVGAPGEIWTRLVEKGPERTAIEVEFCVSAAPEEHLKAIGAGYLALYERLWSEDEAMMRTREAALRSRSQRDPGDPGIPELRLGPVEALRARLPFLVDWKGRLFRIVEIDAQLRAHSTECPHWLGPLGECAIVDGQIVCPWHGFRFDVRTGECLSGQTLRLASAPEIRIDPDSNEVVLFESRVESRVEPRR